MEEIQLDVDDAGTRQERMLALPRLGIDSLGVRAPADMALPGGLEREKVGPDRGLVRRSVSPEGLSRGPELREALLVRDGVLDDQRLDSLGVGESQAESNRAAIVLQVETVAVDRLLLEESTSTSAPSPVTTLA